MAHPRLYYITDRTAFAQNEDEPTRRRLLLEKITEAARAGVDYIQLREKDLSTRDLESLAHDALQAIRDAKKLTTSRGQPATALLINSRTDVALAVAAGGVHLRSDDVSPQEVREIWGKGHAATAALARENSIGCPTQRGFRWVGDASTLQMPPLIGVSCHSPSDVAHAAAQAATFAVFAPVFEKKVLARKEFEKKAFQKKEFHQNNAQPAGLPALHEACRNPIPVLALGGITLSNAHSCLAAGAAGIAAIRLFQENNIAEIVRALYVPG
jgi:thiamine-phosphate pyrophosphorylase